MAEVFDGGHPRLDIAADYFLIGKIRRGVGIQAVGGLRCRFRNIGQFRRAPCNQIEVQVLAGDEGAGIRIGGYLREVTTRLPDIIQQHRIFSGIQLGNERNINRIQVRGTRCIRMRHRKMHFCTARRALDDQIQPIALPVLILLGICNDHIELFLVVDHKCRGVQAVARFDLLAPAVPADDIGSVAA